MLSNRSVDDGRRQRGIFHAPILSWAYFRFISASLWIRWLGKGVVQRTLVAMVGALLL
jgi:hypothetical protein